MNREKAIIYVNCTGNEQIDQKATKILQNYCNGKNYEIVNTFGEDTGFEGLSFPMKYAFVGLATEHMIDKVITIGRFMLGDQETALEFIRLLEDHDVLVESVTNDMEAMYDLLYERMEQSEKRVPDVNDFVEAMTALFQKHQERLSGCEGDEY